jgi:hypothetical protein
MKDVLLMGNKQVGKTTQARLLQDNYKYHTLNFADGVREYASRLISVLTGISQKCIYENVFTEPYYSEYKKDSKPFVYNCVTFPCNLRLLLQAIGNEAREVFGDTIWIEKVANDSRQYRKVRENIVVADGRYPNEANTLKKYNFTVIFLSKEGSDGEHPSEQVQKYYDSGLFIPDLVIDANKSIDEIHEIIINKIK